MFGPGLETETSGIVKRIFSGPNSPFFIKGMFPGQFDGRLKFKINYCHSASLLQPCFILQYVSIHTAICINPYCNISIPYIFKKFCSVVDQKGDIFRYILNISGIGSGVSLQYEGGKLDLITLYSACR